MNKFKLEDMYKYLGEYKKAESYYKLVWSRNQYPSGTENVQYVFEWYKLKK